MESVHPAPRRGSRPWQRERKSATSTLLFMLGVFFSWSSVPLYYSSFIISKRSFGWWCHRQHNLQTLSCLSCVFKMNQGGGFVWCCLGNPSLTAQCLGGLWAAGPTKGRQDLVPPLLSLFNHTKLPAGGHFVWLFKAHSRRLILKTLLWPCPALLH